MYLKYKTIIFDLDGTILNTIDDLADSVNYALGRCGYPLHSTEAVCRFVGNGVDKLIERSAPRGISPEDMRRYRSAFMDYYHKHCTDKTRPYEGIPGLLKKLRDMGATLAVVSNKPDSAVKPLCDDYFPGLFDVAVGEREGIRRKPCPDAVYEVMEQVGAVGEDSVFIGDSDVDVETAKNSGIDSVSVSWGFRTREFLVTHGAELIAENVAELLAFLTENSPSDDS